jgi:hypothetical protein
MSRGSKPGEQRGGRRKGTPNKPKMDALAAELLARAPHPPAPTPHAAVQKRAKDTMAEFAAPFASIAVAYQPIGKDENGYPIFRDNGHRQNFLAFAQKAMVYSQLAAPYQDPTYRAIAVVSAPSDAFARGQLPSNVLDIRDAQTAANEYRRIVCGSKVIATQEAN